MKCSFKTTRSIAYPHHCTAFCTIGGSIDYFERCTESATRHSSECRMLRILDGTQCTHVTRLLSIHGMFANSSCRLTQLARAVLWLITHVRRRDGDSRTEVEPAAQEARSSITARAIQPRSDIEATPPRIAINVRSRCMKIPPPEIHGDLSHSTPPV